MGYLKQTHSLILLVSFFVASILLVMFSSVDIVISNFFYQDGFYLKNTWPVKGLYKSVGPMITLSMLTVIVLWLINKYKGTNILSIDGKKTAFLALVLALGAGLIVNVLFKEQFGRARPRQVIEFNGDKQFTPAFVISDQCERNCSFSSGHGAGAFFTLALALLFKHRRRALSIAFIYGAGVSVARGAAGGHFFSDNITSFFVMAIMTDALYYLFFIRQKELDTPN